MLFSYDSPLRIVLYNEIVNIHYNVLIVSVIKKIWVLDFAISPGNGGWRLSCVLAFVTFSSLKDAAVLLVLPKVLFTCLASLNTPYSVYTSVCYISMAE